MLSVLIVDDSSTIRKMLSALLSDMNFNVVATAASGDEGIKLYNEYRPNLVTMDINMPGITGIEALKKIRDKYKDANILMLTSRGEDQLVVESIKYGAKGYILKPLNKDKIEKAVLNIFPDIFKTDEEKKDEESQIKNYESSIKDTLTNLYTVQYMHHTIQHLIEMHDRSEEFAVGLLIVKINDLDKIAAESSTIERDILLTQTADKIHETIRTTDIAVRLNSDEFAIFVLGSATKDMNVIANRLKFGIEEIKNRVTNESSLEIRIGVVLHQKEEKLIAFIERADLAVIQATKDNQSGIHISN